MLLITRGWFRSNNSLTETSVYFRNEVTLPRTILFKITSFLIEINLIFVIFHSSWFESLRKYFSVSYDKPMNIENNLNTSKVDRRAPRKSIYLSSLATDKSCIRRTNLHAFTVHASIFVHKIRNFFFFIEESLRPR